MGKSKPVKGIVGLLLIGNMLVLIVNVFFLFINMDSTDPTTNIISDEPVLKRESYSFDIYNSGYEGVISGEEMGNYQICFKGYIGMFTEIVIGKGKNLYTGMYIIVDDSKLVVCKAADNSILRTYEHNLEFKDYISINIYADLTDHADIEISTNGGYFIQRDVPWSGRRGTLFVDSYGTNIINDCELSYSCGDWAKPIWLFGDSYFSTSSTTRWTYYLVHNGCDNFMLNGYPGRRSDAALTSLKNELQYAVPEMIIWCMGMNDIDTADNGDEIWENAMYEVMEICEEKGIELILTTIPNVPGIDNSYKNEFVINSGYKYIDFAKAVGSYDSAEWYDSMLEEGIRIHPTETGALALYNEAVASCPELAGKNAPDRATVRESESNGVFQASDGCYYLYQNNLVNTAYSGLYFWKNEWFYIVRGKVDFDYKGLVLHEGIWWYISGGSDFSYIAVANGIVQSLDGCFYLYENGMVNTAYTGLHINLNGEGYYYVVGGKVDFSFNGLALFDGAWWYVEKGRVNFDFTGTAQGADGNFYNVIDGKVVF